MRPSLATETQPLATPSRTPIRHDDSGHSASAPQVGAPTSLVAPARGRRLRIRKLDDDIEPLQIVVPSGFKLHMEGGGELAFSAHLVGPNLEIVVERPEGGFFALSDEKDMVLRTDPAAKFIRAEESPDGYLVIGRNSLSGNGPRYDAVVSRPRLKVNCWAGNLDQVADAERAVSVCLTLSTAVNEPAD